MDKTSTKALVDELAASEPGTVVAAGSGWSSSDQVMRVSSIEYDFATKDLYVSIPTQDSISLKLERRPYGIEAAAWRNGATWCVLAKTRSIENWSSYEVAPDNRSLPKGATFTTAEIRKGDREFEPTKRGGDFFGCRSSPIVICGPTTDCTTFRLGLLYGRDRPPVALEPMRMWAW